MEESWLVERVGSRTITGLAHLSPKGAMIVALRRNISNTAASNMGAAILEDLSRQVVVRYEIEAAAALNAKFQEFHASMDSIVDAQPSLAIACHSFSSDATNSAIWQKAKLQGLELNSCVCLGSRTLCHLR